MTNQLSAKLTALSIALMVNSMLIIAVGFLFNGRLHETAWLQAQSQAQTGGQVQASPRLRSASATEERAITGTV